MKSKRLSALLLVSAMTASAVLSGCGGGTDSSGEGSEATSGNEGTNQEYSSEIDMDEEPYTVAIQVVTLPGTEYAGEEEREAAFNAITEPAINCKVDIQEVWISEIANTTSMAVAGDEKIDLVHVGTVNNLSTLVGADILLDMNEGNLLQNRGQKLMELFADTMEAGNVGGEQLAVPAQVYTANEIGIVYNKTWADEHGITVPETMTFDELSDLLYQVHDADPEMMAYFAGSGTLNGLQFLVGYEGFGSEASYGAVLDSTTDTTVVNLYDSQLFRDYCVRMYEWARDGLMPGDPTDTNSSQDYFGAGSLFFLSGTMGPKSKATYSATAANSGFEVGFSILGSPQITNGYITEYMWGIAVNSERPDKAMDFLNFLYSNEDVANILMYGLEGDNYEFVEGSDDIIQINGTYEPSFYVGGNEADMYIKYPAGEDYIDQLQSLQDEATLSPLAGYMFDDTDFQTESAVISSTIQEYLPRLQNGMCDSEEETLALVDEFVGRLETAGINDVIAANQEQLDAYLAGQE